MSIPPKCILVPTDFSASANAALACAIDLAKANGGRVHLLHAFHVAVVGLPSGAMVSNVDIVAELTDACRKALDDAEAEPRARGIDVTTRLSNGDPRSVIVETAREVGADLIAVGTRGRRGLAHLLLGSTAEYVVRHATVPVLTVHAP